jgi:hypothetical protein
MDPVGPSLLAIPAERCPNCEAPMAADQRYCTECGQRRGRPRLPFMDGRTRPAAVVTAGPARQARMAPSTALIAGICTLLLAMGVGVLIGQSGSDTQSATKAPAVQVVSVPGAAAPAGATAAAAGAAGAAGAAAAKASKSTSGTAATTKKSPKAAKPAATKKAPKVVKLGDKCTGRGCTNGRFTGDFFGG